MKIRWHAYVPHAMRNLTEFTLLVVVLSMSATVFRLDWRVGIPLGQTPLVKREARYLWSYYVVITTLGPGIGVDVPRGETNIYAVYPVECFPMHKL